MSLRDHIPWWAKIAAKMVLSRTGISNATFRQYGIFRHGAMDSAFYSREVFMGHVKKAGLSGGLTGKVILELGPGDGVATALYAYALGAHAVLLDTGRYSGEDVGPYKDMARSLEKDGLHVPLIEHAMTLDEVLAACGASYLCDGMGSLEGLPAESIDFIFSQAVLEHVRQKEFERLIKECRRVIRPSGICSHRVDMRDHLGGGLNNLRFPSAWWETDFFVRSGFYTNRISYTEMLHIFSLAGFSASITGLQRWPKSPIERKLLAREFHDRSEDDLLVSGFDVLLRPV